MSRETRVRIRCHRCFYGYHESVGEPDDVDFELKQRGWGKDDEGQDVCSSCCEDIAASTNRLAVIRERHAMRLLKVHGLEENPAWAQTLVKAQDSVLRALLSGREDYEAFMAEKLAEANADAYESARPLRETRRVP